MNRVIIPQNWCIVFEQENVLPNKILIIINFDAFFFYKILRECFFEK